MSPRNYSKPLLPHHQPGKLRGLAGMYFSFRQDLSRSNQTDLMALQHCKNLQIFYSTSSTDGRKASPCEFPFKNWRICLSATKPNLTSAVVWYCNCSYKIIAQLFQKMQSGIGKLCKAPAIHEATESLQWSSCKHCRPKQRNQLCTFLGVKANLQGLTYDTECIWGHAKEPNGATR